jgi:hypothetical protein
MPLSRRLPKVFLAGFGALIVWSLFFPYVQRLDRPVLYYYGTLEVPQGTAIAVLNPFRNRKDEVNAERLIRDLRTSQCEQIVRERLRADSSRICPILRGSKKARLVWLDAERKGETWAQSRELVYSLHESRSRLFVIFANSEAGWDVDTISLIR